ncbi:MAG: hypothetical protein RR653_13085 [Clostridia bacterium]
MKKVVSLLFAMLFVFELSVARAGEAFHIAEVKAIRKNVGSKLTMPKVEIL